MHSLLAQLQAVTPAPKRTPRKVTREIRTTPSPKEKEYLDILESLGGKASTSELNRVSTNILHAAFTHMSSLEKKGYVGRVGFEERVGANPPVIWGLIKKV